jgi:Zn-dependent protease with chaperone function
MIRFTGTYFDGMSAEARAVEAVFDGGELKISGSDVALVVAGPALRIAPALGQTRRFMRLPNDGRFESDDQQAFAELELVLGKNPGMTWVNAIEKRWSVVFAGIAAVLALVAAALVWGLPWAAQQAAAMTPLPIARIINDQGLQVLDQIYLDPSQLSSARQAQLQALFRQLTRQAATTLSYTLELRHGTGLGANALALPAGTVVMTDELVALALNDQELLGVLAHEVGHVERHHTLRQLYQSVGIGVLLSLATGDAGSITTLAGALPVILLRNGYSQQAELEADAFAAAYLQKQGIGTKPLETMLERLEKSAGAANLGILSTHPGSSERVKRLKASN